MTHPEQGGQTIAARVVVRQPRGPRWLAAAVGVSVGTAGLLAATTPGAGALPWTLCALPAMLGVLRLLPRPARWVEATLELGHGRLQVRGEGARTLRARDIQALSTAGRGRGAVVAVGVRGERWPLLIELPRASQAAAVCAALAVGTRGLGTLRWPLRRPSAVSPRLLGALGLTVSSLLLPLSQAIHSQPLFTLALMALVASVLLTLLDETRSREVATLDLTPHGLDLSATGVGWSLVPYHCLEEVRSDQGLELRLTEPHPTIRISPAVLGAIEPLEMTHIVEQLRTANQRARGLGPDPIDADERLGTLHRGGRESTREWLQRLDAEAGRLSAGAYRSEGYGVADLWQALDDHDAPADLRLGAARVLLRVQPAEARPRVAALADEQRDSGARTAFSQLADEHELDDLAHRLDRCDLWRSDEKRLALRR